MLCLTKKKKKKKLGAFRGLASSLQRAQPALWNGQKKPKDLLELELLLIGPGKIPGKLHPMLSFNSSFSQISLFFSHFFFFPSCFKCLNIKKNRKRKQTLWCYWGNKYSRWKVYKFFFFRDGVFDDTDVCIPAKATHPVPTTYDIKDASRLSIPRLLATSSPGSEKRNDVACKSFFTGAVFFVSSVSRPRGRGEARGCQ